MLCGAKVKIKPVIPRLKQFFICCNSGNVTIEDREEIERDRREEKENSGNKGVKSLRRYKSNVNLRCQDKI